MKPDGGWQKVIKYTQYCSRECNSTLSPIDAKKSREIIKGGKSFWQGNQEYKWPQHEGYV